MQLTSNATVVKQAEAAREKVQTADEGDKKEAEAAAATAEAKASEAEAKAREAEAAKAREQAVEQAGQAESKGDAAPKKPDLAALSKVAVKMKQQARPGSSGGRTEKEQLAYEVKGAPLLLPHAVSASLSRCHRVRGYRENGVAHPFNVRTWCCWHRVGEAFGDEKLRDRQRPGCPLVAAKTSCDARMGQG